MCGSVGALVRECSDPSQSATNDESMNVVRPFIGIDELRAKLIRQVTQIVRDDVVFGIRDGVGWPRRAPLCGAMNEGASVADGSGGHKIEIVARYHHDLLGREGEFFGRHLISSSIRLVDTEKLAT